MTDREKLIALMTDIENQITLAYPYTTDEFRIITTADHLIANGVTIQNWIPVTERLPEVNTDVIVYTIEGYIGTDFRSKDGNWFWNEEFPVTHWMPLPKPPKEES